MDGHDVTKVGKGRDDGARGRGVGQVGDLDLAVLLAGLGGGLHGICICIVILVVRFGIQIILLLGLIIHTILATICSPLRPHRFIHLPLSLTKGGQKFIIEGNDFGSFNHSSWPVWVEQALGPLGQPRFGRGDGGWVRWHGTTRSIIIGGRLGLGRRQLGIALGTIVVAANYQRGTVQAVPTRLASLFGRLPLTTIAICSIHPLTSVAATTTAAAAAATQLLPSLSLRLLALLLLAHLLGALPSPLLEELSVGWSRRQLRPCSAVQFQIVLRGVAPQRIVVRAVVVMFVSIVVVVVGGGGGGGVMARFRAGLAVILGTIGTTGR